MLNQNPPRAAPEFETPLGWMKAAHTGTPSRLVAIRASSQLYRSSFQGAPSLWYPRISQKPGWSLARKTMRVTHFALFQKYQSGMTTRTGPPCSRGIGFPSQLCARSTFESAKTDVFTLVV